MAGKKGNTNKPIDEDVLTETISIRLSKKELDEITKIAENLEMAKTRLIRNLVITSLKDAKLYNNTGILKGVKKGIDFTERWFSPEKYKTLSLD